MTEVLVIVLVSLCGFALIWVGTIWGIGRIGAWHLLAETYRAGGEPTGERLTWQSAVIGGARYKGSLVFVLARPGRPARGLPAASGASRRQRARAGPHLRKDTKPARLPDARRRAGTDLPARRTRRSSTIVMEAARRTPPR